MSSIKINSIINGGTADTGALDAINPYTYIEFVNKLVDDSEAPLLEYQEYLKEWARVKEDSGETKSFKELVRSEIIDLLKILIVRFASYDEQLFLANLDWGIDEKNEELTKAAIKAAIPVFIKRLKDVTAFYRTKRSTVSNSVTANKIKGTTESLERIILNKILQYLFNNSSNDVIVNVEKSLKITVDNLIDISGDYFDVDREESPKENWNDIDYRIYFYLQDVLSGMMFDNNVYLREIPLIAQLNVDLTVDCVGDKLILKNQLIEDSELCLVPDDEKIRLRKKLFQKYLGTDFHYLWVRADGTVLTDRFIKADNPTGNLLNVQTADAPKSVDKQLEKLKNIGLFFKPGKTGMLRVNMSDFTYSIDINKVKRRTLYIFPDPSLYSNVGFNKQAEYPLILEYSFDEYVKSPCFGLAANEPFLEVGGQPCFAYYSKEQDLDKSDPNSIVLKNFDSVYNDGIIESYRVDLYGNKYALLAFGGKYGIDVRSNIPDRQTNVLEQGNDPVEKSDALALSSRSRLVYPVQDLPTTVSRAAYIHTIKGEKPVKFANKFNWLDRYSEIIGDPVFIDVIDDNIIVKNKYGKILIDRFEYDVETDTFRQKVSYKEPVIIQPVRNTKGEIFFAPSESTAYFVDIERVEDIGVEQVYQYVLYVINTDKLSYVKYKLDNPGLIGKVDVDPVMQADDIKLSYSSVEDALVFGFSKTEETNNYYIIKVNLKGLPAAVI